MGDSGVVSIPIQKWLKICVILESIPNLELESPIFGSNALPSNLLELRKSISTTHANVLARKQVVERMNSSFLTWTACMTEEGWGRQSEVT